MSRKVFVVAAGIGLISFGFAGGYQIAPRANPLVEARGIEAGSESVAQNTEIEISDDGVATVPLPIILPIEAVAMDGIMPTVGDVTHRDALLNFTSSVPLACSVVYGKTDEFGMIATDLDMDGGGHTNHAPLMAGLEPDTVYFYRVQGTAADGSVYVGETSQFISAPAPELPPLREDIAENLAENPAENLAIIGQGMVIASVSSNYGDAENDQNWGVNRAFDGNERTAWSSNGDGDDASLTLNFNDEVAISGIEVWSRTMSDGTAQITSFTLTDDGGTIHGPFSLPDASQTYAFDVNIETAQLRFDVESSSGGNTGLLEFKVLGQRR